MAIFDIMFARFPFGRCDDPDVTDWLVGTVVKCKLDPRIGRVANFWKSDTPIPMLRNLAIEAAKADKCHFLVMVDNDMSPDCYLASNRNRLDILSDALPFWDSSIDFMIRNYVRGPCMVGSPYCGPPPHEMPYIFRWANMQSDHPNADAHIEPYTREEAAIRSGFEEVACLPTGLVIVDMRVFDNPLVNPPYFDYEYTDRFQQKKASTEDCMMTRDLNIANIPLYVNWDAWSGHWKKKCVGKPKPIYREQIHQKFIDAAQKNISARQKLLFVQESDGYEGSGTAPVPGDAAASSPTPGGKCDSAGDGQDGVRVIELEPGNFRVATEVPRRSVSIGVFGRG